MSTLIPPDPDRCQATITVKNFMQLGPETPRRCDNTPTVIVVEREAKEGEKGSMSLCDECLAVAKGQLGENYFTIWRKE